MSSIYYNHVRSEIRPLLPATAGRIVDVGCGAGVTLAWLKELYPDAYTIGLEGNGELRPQLERNANEAHIVDLSSENVPDIGAPDLILFLDVLEHLVDPLSALVRLTSNLAPGGAVIISLPNVAHLSVSLPLLMKGNFTYQDEGILDRTHLRFFDQTSAVELAANAGLVADQGLMAGLDGRKTRWLDKITLGRLRDRLSKQYVFRCTRRTGEGNKPIVWQIAPPKAHLGASH